MSLKTVIKKTIRTSLGDVCVPNTHGLCRSGGGFGVSPHLQELACFVGQGEVFDHASVLLKKVGGADLCDKQIERICHHYGQSLGEIEAAAINSGTPSTEITKGERYYAMLDGGMVMTREGGWKEMKLARIMNEKSVLKISDKRGWIRASTYTAHLGHYKEFLRKVDRHTDEITDMVLVADGAPWIWKWADDLHPNSIKILDFYHAKEHLCDFAKLRFEGQEQRSLWIETQSSLLLEDKVELVIQNIKALEKTRRKGAEELRRKLIHYYRTNRKRMMYKTFRENGLMIGSGPIESAHRNVIQSRMKRSGQRWTNEGAQQMANLRAAMEGGQWPEVEKIIRKRA
jgi:hypothetical protein